jgi:UDP-perosamine 4-acetyltransferase
MNSKYPVIVIGGGGHARVCMDVLHQQNIKCLGYTDLKPNSQSQECYLGLDEIVFKFSPDEVQLINGIGKIGHDSGRKEIFKRFKECGYKFADLIHPSTIISTNVKLGEGIQIMAGCVIQTGVHIGNNTIVNSRVVLEHDCRVGDHTHISPGVIVCGGCFVGEHVHIGAGATIIQGIEVENDSLIGAGATVIRKVRSHSTVYGVPAKEVQK